MTDQTADPDSDFIDRCERITHDGIVISEESRLRLFRLAGHTEEPLNYMIAWPSVWAMIADARDRHANPRCPAMTRSQAAVIAPLMLGRIATSYGVDISDADMISLEKAERRGVLFPWNEHLCKQLLAINGISDVEYNGHFGASVYFSLDAEEDTPATHETIISLIRTHLDRCRTALEREIANVR